MIKTAAVPVVTRIVVHILGVDSGRRVLLSRAQEGDSPGWALPTAMVAVGEDPAIRARQLLWDAGSLAATRAEVIDLESVIEGDTHLVHVVFECGAHTNVAPPRSDGQAFWWELSEIASLTLSTRTRMTLAARWSLIWPDI